MKTSTRTTSVVAILLAAAIVSGCGSLTMMKESRQTASLVDYLYSGQQPVEKPQQASITELNVPLRIGIAFVPGAHDPKLGISDVQRIRWTTQVKEAFEKYPFVGELVVVPTAYLRSGGGFDNLRQLSASFNLDVIALLSYDQVQYSESNSWSYTYIYIVPAFVIPGDEYEIHTTLEATVYDIRTRKLLFRAPGTSIVKGSSTMVNFSGRSRQARAEGFDSALKHLNQNVDIALQEFRKRAPDDPSIKLSLPAGYDPNVIRRSSLETATR